MTTKTNTTILLILSTLLAGTAAADDRDGGFDRPMEPVRDAFEIAVGGGYMQAHGATGTGAEIEDLAGPGGNAELHLGHRVMPNLTIGAYGTLGGFSNGDLLSNRHDVVGAQLGLKGDWHFRPARSIDPWISLGGGARWIWMDDSNRAHAALRGLDLARVQLGVDYRVSKGFAIAPAIGATATMYFDHDDAMTAGYRDIGNKEVSWTFGGSLLGRFDIGR